jgi:hypothetical protein
LEIAEVVMKNAVLLAVPVLLVFVGANLGYGEDGAIPQATLSSLGLGDMDVASDQEGLQVRGMSSNAGAGSLSIVGGLLFDPATGSSFNFSNASSGMTTDENAGLQVSSSVQTQTLAVVSPIDIQIAVQGVTVFRGLINRGLAAQGNAIALAR